jgi:hypothetical protein
MDLLELLAEFVVLYMTNGMFLVQLVSIAVAGVPMTLLHEFGHAFAAVNLLGEDVEVEAGNYGRFAELQLGRITVTMNAIAADPTKPAGYAEFDASRATARDVLLIALAGPAASLLGTLLTALVLYATSPGWVLAMLLWTTILVGVIGVLNAAPFRYQTTRRSPMMRSDGLLALDALRVMRALR